MSGPSRRPHYPDDFRVPWHKALDIDAVNDLVQELRPQEGHSLISGDTIVYSDLDHICVYRLVAVAPWEATDD